MTQLLPNELKHFLAGAIYKGRIAPITLRDITTPRCVDNVLQELGYTRIDWDNNGWEGDNWIYYTSENNEISFILYFCAWTFDIKLIFGDGEE